jgi:hypothetical protein
MKRAVAVLLGALALTTISAQAQFPAQGDDHTTSLGSFKIQVNANFQPMFAGCPGFASPVLSSPTMFDPATVVGRSNVILDGSPGDINGVPVGTAGTIVSDGMLFPPPGFPCTGVTGACSSGPNTREVHTEVRSLKMTAGPVAVRAGLWYNSAVRQSPPARVSPGEVVSQSGPTGVPATDFPASSFFDVFVQTDMPACGTGGFPGATLYNSSPLIVKNLNLTMFPPKVVYLHDTSTVVPILFLNANPPLWNAGDILGYFVLAGHGVGFTNSPADINAFNQFMNCQSLGSAPGGTTADASKSLTSIDTVNCISAAPDPAPAPSPQPD